MNNREILYDMHGRPLPIEIINKIRASIAGASKYPQRTLKCPFCGMRIADVYGKGEVFVSVKCPKCKAEGVPLSLSAFRTTNYNKTK